MFNQMTKGVSIDFIAQDHLGRDFVTFRYGHIPHVIAEPGNSRPLAVIPGCRHSHPDGQFLQGFRIPPMTDDHLAVLAHAGIDKPKLPIAMGRLMQVHVIHINFAPGNIPVILGMEVYIGFVQQVQTGNPHPSR